MNVTDVIAQDAERNGKRPASVLTGVMEAVDRRKAKLLHDNASVIILDPIEGSKSAYNLHLFTADKPQGLAKSAKVLLQQVRALPGVQKVYGTTKNNQLLRLLKMTGVNVMEPDRKGYTWMTEL